MSAIGSLTSAANRLFIPAAILLASGCGGIPAARPQIDGDEAHLASRREEDFRKAQDVARALRLQITQTEAEKEKLAAELAELRSEVRVERQRADQAVAEKAKREDAVVAAEARAEASRKTLERACILLALVATEISSVRLHWREFESRVRESGVREEDLDVLERKSFLGTKIEELHFELLREKNLIAPYLKERRKEAQVAELEDDARTRERRMNSGGAEDPLLDPARIPNAAELAPRARSAPPRPDEVAAAGQPGDESKLTTILRQKWDETSAAGDIGLKVGFGILCAAALVLLLRRGRLRRAPEILRSCMETAGTALSRLLGRNRAEDPDLVPKQDIEKVLGILEDESRSSDETAEVESDPSPPRALFEGTPAERARARIAARAAAAVNAEAAVLASGEDPVAPALEEPRAEEATPEGEGSSKGTEVLGERPGAPEEAPPDAGMDTGTQVIGIEASGTQVLEPSAARTEPDAALTIPMNPPDTSDWRTPEKIRAAGRTAEQPGTTQPIEEPGESTEEEATGTDIIEEASMDSWTLESRGRKGEGSGPAAGTQMMEEDLGKDFQPTQVLSDSGGLDIGSTQVISSFEKLLPYEPAPRGKEPRGKRRQPPSPQKPPKPRKPSRKSRDEDENLLAELEEIIGHKVDENPA